MTRKDPSQLKITKKARPRTQRSVILTGECRTCEGHASHHAWGLDRPGVLFYPQLINTSSMYILPLKCRFAPCPVGNRTRVRIVGSDGVAQVSVPKTGTTICSKRAGMGVG